MKTLTRELAGRGLLEQEIVVKAKVLSTQEAIGNPEEYDFPLLKGREKIVEADFAGHQGHAFTDMYGGFTGSLKDVLKMPDTNNYRRAMQVAAINAVCHFLGKTTNTVHCRDREPQECARQSVDWVASNYPHTRKICFVGFQPALVDAFAKHYELKVLDLDNDNIGKKFFGQTILDGGNDQEASLMWADLVLATGSVIVNDTIDQIVKIASLKRVIFYGVTIAGPAALAGWHRLCFARDS